MNFKSRIVMGCLLGVCVLQVSAEKTYKYRISLRDKAETAYSVGSPQAYLSERALERRERQGLKVDETDLPVCRTYVDAIVGKGASVVTKSKWNNTVVVEVADTALIEQIAELPFVVKTKKVWTAPDSIPARNAERKKEVTNKFSKRITIMVRLIGRLPFTGETGFMPQVSKGKECRLRSSMQAFIMLTR